MAICLAALIATASGCGADNTSTRLTLAEVMPNVDGADPRLVAITEQASELLPGGRPAFRARIESLKGLPIVVNKWASWCPPCAAEAPYLQATAKKYGNRVAFLGVNVSDNNAKAEQFTRRFPMPYPSYSDPNVQISKEFPPPGRPPVTNIYDSQGRLVHSAIGQIRSAAELGELIERYAGPLKAGPTN